ARQEEERQAVGVLAGGWLSTCHPSQADDIEIAGYWFRDGEEPGMCTLVPGQDLEEALRNVIEVGRTARIGLPGGSSVVTFVEGDTVFWGEPIDGRTSGPISEITTLHVGPEAETARGPGQPDEEVPEGPIEEQGPDQADEEVPEGPVEEEGLAQETAEQEDDLMEITNEGEAAEEADPMEKAATQWEEVMAAADGGDEAAGVLRAFVLQKHGARAPAALWTMLKVFGRHGWRDLPIGGLGSLTREIPAEVFFNEEPPEVLFDRVNPEAVKEIGRRVLSKVFRTADGCGPTLLRIAGDILKQCGRGMLSGARCFLTTYREESKMMEIGMKGRRYSGFCPVVKKKKKDEEEEDHSPQPDGGLVSAHVRTSVFAQPCWLRDVFRAGLPNHFVFDLVNAEYIDRRDTVLSETHVERWIAKQLYLPLLYGGSVKAWKMEHKITAFAREGFAHRFAKEMSEGRKKDCGARKGELGKLRQMTARPVEFLQYALNTATERELVDLVVNKVEEDPEAAVCAFEHDGLFLYYPAGQKKLFADIKSALGDVSFTVKPTLSVKDALATAEAEILKQAPELGHLWNQVDDAWLDHHNVIMQAYEGSLTYHGLYAEVALRSPAVSPDVPYPLTAIFKMIVDTGHKCWFSCSRSAWFLTGDSTIDALKLAASKICVRDLSDYICSWSTSEDAIATANIRWEYTGESFKSGLAASLKPALGVAQSEFDLDGEDTRKYLNFNGKVFNAETLQWSPMRPEMKITRNTGWDHKWPVWWGDYGAELLGVLKEVRRQQDSFKDNEREYTLSAAVQKRLDELCGKIPALDVVHTWTRDDWESTIFELSLFAKGTFGLTQACGLWTRGVGRNGKDTAANMMDSVLGGYSVSLLASTLSKIRDPNAPSPAYALLRARRFVAVREIDKCDPIRQQIYKTVTDPNSVLSGRDVYEKQVSFKPQFLMFFASNEPPALVNDLANRERTCIIEHVSIFSDEPVEENQVKWKDVEKTMLRTDEGRAEFFAILYAVYKELLHDNPRRSIGPMPQKCRAFLEEELDDKVMAATKDFIRTRLERAPRGKATPESAVHDALAKHIEEKAPPEDHKPRTVRCGDLLKQLGVVRSDKRGKAATLGGRKNVYHLHYKFEGTDGSKDDKPTPVRLIGYEPEDK
ncbi:unnamed protein product, partial [Symbiodinium sp. CCMP2456]